MRRLQLGTLAVLSVAVAVVSPLMWALGVFDAVPSKPPLLAHLLDRAATSSTVFCAHIAGGAIALVVGPWQLASLSHRRRNIHRAGGYAYVAAVAIAGAAGLLLATRAWGGPLAQAGFTLLALGWLGTTTIAVHRILVGDPIGHRLWMWHSFALSFAAVSLRLQSPLLGLAGVPDAIAYPLVAWTCWLPNLLIVRVITHRATGELQAA